MMLSTSTKSTMCPFCDQPFTRLAAHLPRCKQREGRDYTSYLASCPKGPPVNSRGRCSGCNRVFKRLDTHYRTSATCKQRSMLVPDPPSIASHMPSSTAVTMNTVGLPAVPSPQPPQHIPAPPPPVCVANKPNRISLSIPFAMPQPNESWEEDNDSLACSLVHQVFAAQSVDDKNRVLCEGIYQHFTNK